MEQSKQTTKQTICWGCARALLIPGVACPWSLYFHPVPGWTARRNDIVSQNNGLRTKRSTESYVVSQCPLFLSDEDYNKKNKNKEEFIMQQGINTSDTSKMERFDMKTKDAVPEIKIKDRSISLPAVDTFDAGKEIVVFISKDGQRIELEQGADGFPVSATGRGGAGRIIYCQIAIASLKKRGIQIPQRAEVQCNGTGKWFAELKTAEAGVNT